MRRVKQCLGALACCSVFFSILLAQDTTGTIAGTVSDSSEATVAGVQVTVTNENTGLKRAAISGNNGSYRIPFLPVGFYAVQVSKEGFKSQAQTGVRLEILQVRTVDFKLALGQVSETVTVESQAPLVDAETSQAGEVIKAEQVTNLPLGRRNFMQLTFLAPMSTPANSDFRSTEIGRGSSVPASAGQRPEQNNYQIDGIDNKETGRNGYAVSPPVDSISEFKVQTGMAPAEFGRGGGTIINVVTKSGSNTYHGTLYEFLRNQIFDARPYFASGKTPLKLNQFGGALGGPIKHDKLFFFGNYEGLRLAQGGNPSLMRVFSENERQGIFNTRIYDPVEKKYFDNNAIPQSRIDPTSLKILDLVPHANRSDPLRNYVYDGRPAGRTTTDNAVGRVDYILGTNDTLYGRYLFNQEQYGTPQTMPAPANSGGKNLDLRAQSASVHWNHVISPSLVHNLSLGYTRYHNLISTLNSFKNNYVADVGITNTLSDTDPLFWAAPNVSIPGYTMPSEETPNYRTTNNYQIQDSLFWNKGRHNIKLGGDLRDIREFMFYTGGNGSTSFSNAYTGNNVADFLLGLSSSVSKTARATQWNSKVYYLGAYIQDDWKVSSRLTLNLGLRYEVESALRQQDNGGLGFDLATGTMLVSRYATNRSLIEDFYVSTRPDIPLAFSRHRAPYDADTNNIAPRVGFAYRLRDKTVLRGGYGIFYDAPQIQSMASSNDFAPNTLRPTWTASPTAPSFGYNPEGKTSAEEALRKAALSTFPFTDRYFPYGVIQQWMFSIQQQLSSSLVIEGLYQGSTGTHLLSFDNADMKLPGPGNVQQQLPYPQFARIQSFQPNARSWYNGAAIKAEQRFSRGLSYLVAYTYSKSLDTVSTLNVGPQFTDPTRKLETSKGLSDFDVRNRFTAAFEYSLPFGKGRAIGGDFSGVLDRLVSGWGARGSVSLQGGFPASPSMNISRVGICASSCVSRPDRIGDGNLSADERTLDRYFDVTAFQVLPPGGTSGRVGNAGRNILIQPDSKNLDLQIFKNTRIFENHTLEFRWEMYNAFNHANWGSAATNMEAPDTFGVISSRGAPRSMQFGLKYQF